jgi:hypothetical protein
MADNLVFRTGASLAGSSVPLSASQRSVIAKLERLAERRQWTTTGAGEIYQFIAELKTGRHWRTQAEIASDSNLTVNDAGRECYPAPAILLDEKQQRWDRLRQEGRAEHVRRSQVINQALNSRDSVPPTPAILLAQEND